MRWLGAWVGSAFCSSGRYRRRLLSNARQAGLPLRTALASVGESGKMVAETPRLWLGQAHETGLGRRVGRGVCLDAWLGCVVPDARTWAVSRSRRRPWHSALANACRSRCCFALPASLRCGIWWPPPANAPICSRRPPRLAGVKQLIKALKSQQAVGLLPDQVPPAGQGVWAPFFGREAYTMTLSARLAHTPGVQLVLIWGERLSWGRGYLVHVRPCRSRAG